MRAVFRLKLEAQRLRIVIYDELQACSRRQMGEQLLNDRVAMSRIDVLDVDDTFCCGGDRVINLPLWSKMWPRLRGAAARSGTPRLRFR